MLQHLITKHFGLGLLVGTLIVGCAKNGNRLWRETPLHYTIAGTIYDEYGGASNSRMGCYSFSRLMKYVQPDLKHGNYTIALTPTQATELRHFQIISWDDVTTEFAFDRRLLKDSIITLDFKLRTLPKPYKVHMAVTEHPPSRSYDTLWLDLKGRRVTKAYSDSVWRRVPLRDRRRK